MHQIGKTWTDEIADKLERAAFWLRMYGCDDHSDGSRNEELLLASARAIARSAVDMGLIAKRFRHEELAHELVGAYDDWVKARAAANDRDEEEAA